ncbi:MAG: tyrosine-type recombinase/integrase [Gammaproteobacteria bacterium]|nr:tyrosine-type recombinase/integrase [Gammaproteobacteria bacterium]
MDPAQGCAKKRSPVGPGIKVWATLCWIDRLHKNRLTDLVKKYIEQAGIGKPGACHLFRHTMATLMLDNGADIRHIQAMLGHSQLSTTEIYTQVSIRKLKEIHALTHPADRPRQQSAGETGEAEADEWFSALATEADDEQA